LIKSLPNTCISIVSPVYQAENIVDKLVEDIISSVSKITTNYEIILVEDGSPDRSWECIDAICAQEKRVKGIKISRNFGQHNAITASLQAAKGEWMGKEVGQITPRFEWSI
jgi:polyisoprenyl-phosphate glycosyltransferase